MQSRIDALLRAPRLDSRALAALYAVQAQSYSALELDAQARESALKGLPLAPSLVDPLQVDLLIAYADNVYDATDINRVIETLQAARAAQQKPSAADICLLITLGRLQFRQDHAAQAVASLTQAYRASMTPALAAQQVAAASALSTVLRNVGDFQQALALNQEVVDWDTAHDASLDLSISRYLRGRIFAALHNYGQAIEEYSSSRQLSTVLDDSQGIAFADMSTCEAQIELGQLAHARPQCQNAARIFTSSHSNNAFKQTQALLARIDLAQGRADQALNTLNQVLDHAGTDMPPRQAAPNYYLRARSEGALHDYGLAYEDLNQYVQRYTAENELDRTQQVAVLRARFDTDHEIERNATLERELALSTERLQLRKQELRWTVVIIALAAFILVMLTGMLIANRRHRRELLRLARLDGLTGLPNRRRTGELATAAISSAAVAARPVTVALIDLDHFKVINDRCGHAVGDHVLTEFARLGRDVLRASDTLGRWGGEEFLLILPDTGLDTALTVIQRMRSKAATVQLPATARGLQVSFSAGLATRTKIVQSLNEIVASADAALYEAKNGGRNLIRLDRDTYRTAESNVLRALYGGIGTVES